jgi:DNA relaxase NicK
MIAQKQITPDTDRGVEFSIDWLTLTVFCSVSAAISIYDKVLKQFLGNLQIDKFGFAGYKQSLLGLNGFRIFHDLRTKEERVTFVIPGQACQAIYSYQFIDLMAVIEDMGYRYNVTRLDLAFDHELFTPLDVWQAAHEEGIIRTDAKRSSFVITSSPWAEDDRGDLGTNTVYIGSRSSERMLRVYDKRGYTRVELELKGKRAKAVSTHLFHADPDSWYSLAMGHLMDFVTVNCAWWESFTGACKRAYMKITAAAEYSVEKLVAWVDRQVGGALHVIREVLGEGELLMLARKAQLTPRYKVMISSYGGSHG